MIQCTVGGFCNECHTCKPPEDSTAAGPVPGFV